MKTGLDRLLSKFHFMSVCRKDTLSRRSGKTAQFFRYTNLGANTTAKSPEGSVGTSSSLSSRVLSITVSQYTNFITLSDMLEATALDDMIQSASELLGESAGLSVDTITRAVIDNEASSTNLALSGSYLKAQDFRTARHLLAGVNVQPFEDNLFRAYAHPYCTFDLINDPTANGLADIHKHTNPSMAGLIRNEDRGEVTIVGSCKIFESTNVALVAGSPNKWRVYIFGANAVGALDLAGKAPSNVVDPKKQSFNINVFRGGNATVYDPEGVIAGGVSYNFAFGLGVLDGPTGIGGTYRFKTIDAPSSIVA
jgi:N4-gp56 family major capsid protein